MIFTLLIFACIFNPGLCHVGQTRLDKPGYENGECFQQINPLVTPSGCPLGTRCFGACQLGPKPCKGYCIRGCTETEPCFPDERCVRHYWSKYGDCVYTGPPTTTTTAKPEPRPLMRWQSCVLKEGYTPPEPEEMGIIFEIVKCKPNEYCKDWEPKGSPTSGYLGKCKTKYNWCVPKDGVPYPTTLPLPPRTPFFTPASLGIIECGPNEYCKPMINQWNFDWGKYFGDCVYIGPSTTSTTTTLKPIEFCAPNDDLPNPEFLGPFMIIVKCKPNENCVPLRKPFGKLNYGECKAPENDQWPYFGK